MRCLVEGCVMWRNKVIQRRFRKKADKVMQRCKRNLVSFVETMIGCKLDSTTKNIMINLSDVDFEKLRFEMHGRR